MKASIWFLVLYEIFVAGTRAEPILLEIGSDTPITFTSPGYDVGHYPLNIDTFWELHAPNTLWLHLLFQDFELEYHPSCKWDYVKIHVTSCDDLSDHDHETILCGTRTSYSFNSTGNMLCVHFRSDQVIARKGFKAKVTAETESSSESSTTSTSVSPVDNSSQTSTVTSATISELPPSTAAPSTTVSSSSLLTTLLPSQESITPSENNKTQPTLSSLIAGSSKAMSVSGGSSSTSSAASSTSTTPLQMSSTHSTLSTTSTASTETSSSSKSPSSATTSTHSTSSTSSTSLTTPTSSKQSTSSPTTSSTVSTTKLSTSTVQATTQVTTLPAVDIDVCDDILAGQDNLGTVDHVLIRSPNDTSGYYPGKYAINKHCTMSLQNPQYLEVDIEFIKFHVENHVYCVWDYVQVTMGTQTTKRMCGHALPETLVTNSTPIMVTFHSDHVVPGEGFLIKMSVIHETETEQTPPTTEQMTTEVLTTTEQITTQAHTEQTTHKTTTQQITTQNVTTPSAAPTTQTEAPTTTSTSTGTEEVITTSKPPLPTTSDELTIPTTTVPQSSSTITEEKPTTKVTTSKLTVEVTTSKPTSQTTTADSVDDNAVIDICASQERVQLSTKMFIVSPGYLEQQDYPLDTECALEIRPPSDKAVVMSIQDFNVELNGRCAWDHLTLEQSVKKTRFCGYLDKLSSSISAYSGCSPNYLMTVDANSKQPQCLLQGGTEINLESTDPIKFIFYSDSYIPKRGFNISLSVIDTKAPTTEPNISYEEYSPTPTSESPTSSSTIPSVTPSTDTISPTSTLPPVSSSTITIATSVSSSTNAILSVSPTNANTASIAITDSPISAVTSYSSVMPSSTVSLSSLSETSAISTSSPATSYSVTLTSSVHVFTTETQTLTSVMSSSYNTVKSSTPPSPSSVIVSTFPSTLSPSSTSAFASSSMITPSSTLESGQSSIIQPTPSTPSTASPSTSVQSTTIQISSTEAFQTTLPSSDVTSTEEISSTSASLHSTTPSISVTSPIIWETTTTSAIPTTSQTTLPPQQPESACNGDGMPLILTDATGYIESPGYKTSSLYPPNSRCKWKIQSQMNKVIVIIFEAFNVEQSPHGCLWDKLAFYNTSSSGSDVTMMKELCGTQLPSSFHTTGSMVIEFISDSIQERSGFRLKYIKTNAGQVGGHTCPAGRTPCMGTHECIPVEWWCDSMPDCADQSDEQGCATCSDGQFTCSDGTCISNTLRCDGHADCTFATDETGCVSVSDDVTVPVSVEVGGRGYNLCHNNVTETKATQLCRKAGFRSSESVWSKTLTNAELATVIDDGSDDIQLTLNYMHIIALNQLSGIANRIEATMNVDLFLFTFAEEDHAIWSKYPSETCDGNEATVLKCTDQDCGRKGAPYRKKRIIGGTVSSSGEWPWSVALRAGNNVICGGSIINDLWVVTAGHCVNNMINNPQVLSIVAGSSDLNGGVGQVIHVSEVMIHPQYSFIFNADIALLRLQKRVTFNDDVKPICLPWDKRQVTASSTCFIVGYGVADMKDYFTTVAPRYLRHVRTKIVNHDVCRAAYSYKAHIEDSMICAGYIGGGMDACKGDSGGGLMCEVADGRWSLVGVISWGDMCGSTNKPGVYTSTVSFLDWIDGTTKVEESPSVTCTFENNWCGYSDMSTENYFWTRRPGDKYVKGYVMYASRPASTSHDYTPTNATLMTPVFTSDVDSCLEFQFLFSSNSNVTLSVFGVRESDVDDVNGGEGKLLWQITSNYPSKDVWKSTQVTVPGDVTRLKFESLHAEGGIYGVGLDNITLVQGACTGSHFLRCDFDDNTTCSYSNNAGTNIVPWRFEASDASSPDSGHFLTTGGDLSEFGYMSLSQLLSPSLPATFTSLTHCVHFKFKVFTSGDSRLVLATYIAYNTQLNNQNIYWDSDTASVGVWHTADVTIGTGVYAYNHIVFEMRRNSYSSDIVKIGLDNISVSDGTCV